MSEPVDEVVDLHGTRIKVQQAGSGAPLLFLHGAGGRNWTRYIGVSPMNFA